MPSSSGFSGPRRVAIQEDRVYYTDVGDLVGGRAEWVVERMGATMICTG
jgi:hypothetical protein